MLGANVNVILDVGANRGDVTQTYSKAFPEASIYAFEPFPDSYLILQQRFSENSKISCYQKAVAENNKTKTFYVNKNVDTNSLLKPQNTGLSSDKQVENLNQIEVESLTLDEFCESKKIDKVDILKMDIQGGEFNALHGARNLLKEGKISLIYSEVYFIEQYEKQPLFHDVSKLLFQYGYTLQDIYSPIYGKGNIAWADVVFVKNK
ncbi:FkbM family methyltransferase [Paraflavitalea speifideaquila]|uniref:FkbM family methyltransferase n=1 Tax=Paraflavitalea speifideaquila TaxID=3076558 RepID=UPI0028E7638A|nr:FkbM family methyltransferase [Paraflavitalea speifideiaquila]